MTALPALKHLYKRELMVAPRPAFAIIGCQPLQSTVADFLKERAKLTNYMPNLSDIEALLGA